jgi:tetratricopeptide (TPR) repeat protein
MKILIPILLLLTAVPAGAQQSPARRAYEGNNAFASGKFNEAIAAYQEAMAAKDTSLAVPFNLGTALLKAKKPGEARAPLTAAAARAAKEGRKGTEAAAHYNIGSTYLDERKWQEAVNTYKAALKKNPADADAKYNLSYALKHLKKGGGGGGGNDKKEGPKEGDDKKEDPQDKGKNNSKLSPQQAEQILDAVAGEEKELQKKLRRGKGNSIGVEKDW